MLVLFFLVSVPVGQYMAPCQWWDGLRKKSGSFRGFERQLLVFTLLESGPSKWACSGGKYCCLGALGFQLAGTWHPARGEIDWEKKWFIWQFSARITGPYPLRKWLRKTDLFWAWFLLFGGSQGGPQGSKAGSPGSHLVNTWPLASAEMGWEKKVVHLAVLREIYWSLHRLRKFAIWLHPKKSKNCAR